MQIARLYSEPGGKTRLVDVDIPSEESSSGAMLVTHLPGAEGVFTRRINAEADRGSDQFHPSLRRQYAVMLAGQMEIWVPDGTSRIFRPGDIIMTEDTEGEGHGNRNTSDQTRLTLYLPMV